MALSILTMCNHHHDLVPELSTIPSGNPAPTKQSLCSSPSLSAPDNHSSAFCVYGFAYSGHFK